MQNVVPNLLWIGNISDIEDLRPLFALGIEALVDLAWNEKPAQLTRELIYCRFPLNDGGGNSPRLLGAAVDGAISLISRQIPTLVYCSAGMSRSLAITSMALARCRAQKPEDVLLEVASGRPHDVSPVLWSDLCAACE